MGRYSDSDDESSRKLKKKKKRRSRSRSRSADSSGSHYSHSHKHKKSKKKHRHRSRSYSRSPDRHSRRDRPVIRRRRSRSPDRARRSRSSERGQRSRSYERKRTSRSRSRDRRSRSDSRDRVSSRRRSTSRERGGHHSRSDSGSRSQYDSRRSSAERKRGRRSPSPSQVMSISESNTLDEIPGFKDMTMSCQTPAEQAQMRLKMALRAATMSTEKLKEQPSSPATSSSPLSRQQFADAVATIESDSFAPTAFKSSRSSKSLKENREASSELPSHNMAMFGAVGNSVVFTKTEPVDKGTLPLEDNPDTLFDPSLNVDPEEKMDRWIQKLTAMRRKKLEGEIIHSY